MTVLAGARVRMTSTRLYTLSILLHCVNYFLQLHLVQDLKSFSWRNLCELDVVVIEFLFHHLLQYPQRQFLGFQKADLLGRRQLSKVPSWQDIYLVPLVLKLALCSL